MEHFRSDGSLETGHHGAVLCNCCRITFVDSSSQPMNSDTEQIYNFQILSVIVLGTEDAENWEMSSGLILRNSNGRTSALHGVHYDMCERRYLGLKTRSLLFPKCHSEKCSCLPASESMPEIRSVSTLAFTRILTKYLAQKWALGNAL